MHYDVAYLAQLYEGEAADDGNLHLCRREEVELALSEYHNHSVGNDAIDLTEELLGSCLDCNYTGLLSPENEWCFTSPAAQRATKDVRSFYTHAQFLVATRLIDDLKRDYSVFWENRSSVRKYHPLTTILNDGSRRNKIELPNKDQRCCEECGDENAERYVRGLSSDVALRCLECAGSFALGGWKLIEDQFKDDRSSSQSSQPGRRSKNSVSHGGQNPGKTKKAKEAVDQSLIKPSRLRPRDVKRKRGSTPESGPTSSEENIPLQSTQFESSENESTSGRHGPPLRRSHPNKKRATRVTTRVSSTDRETTPPGSFQETLGSDDSHKFDSSEDGGEFCCESCDKVFPSYQSLSNHCTKSHGSLDPYNGVCPKCGKCSTNWVGKPWCVRKHIKTVHNRKKYICSICGSELSAARSLKGHMKLHQPSSKDDGLACTFCPKKLKSKSRLNYHMLVYHGAQLPWKCELCGRGFASFGGLQTHKAMVHTASK